MTNVLQIVALVAASLAQAGTVSGIVVDDRTGQPVREVLVSVEDLPAAAETDAGGRFTLTVPRGRGTIVPSMIGSIAALAGRSAIEEGDPNIGDGEIATATSRAWLASLAWRDLPSAGNLVDRGASLPKRAR